MEKHDPIISEPLLAEIASFEAFFEAAGFKRIYGSIYGVLVLAPRALSSHEIEEILGISQSAVSQAIKILNHFGAIQMSGSSIPRQRLYSAKDNSLSVVSSIVKRREQEHIEDFKRMSERVMGILKKEGAASDDIRVLKIKSIGATCIIGKTLTDFIVRLGDERYGNKYLEMAQRLPTVLDALLQGKESLNIITNNLADKFKSTLLKNIGGLK